MGIAADSAEEFWLKYGHDEILPREHGRLHVAWPFIGRKTLTERQKE